jgi:hypothetical protein
MATQDQYVVSVVEKYRVALEEGSPSHRVADEIAPLIKQWGQEYVQGITISGAYAKNTAIALASHVGVGPAEAHSWSRDQERLLETI